MTPGAQAIARAETYLAEHPTYTDAHLLWLRAIALVLQDIATRDLTPNAVIKEGP